MLLPWILNTGVVTAAPVVIGVRNVLKLSSMGRPKRYALNVRVRNENCSGISNDNRWNHNFY